MCNVQEAALLRSLQRQEEDNDRVPEFLAWWGGSLQSAMQGTLAQGSLATRPGQ